MALPKRLDANQNILHYATCDSVLWDFRMVDQEKLARLRKLITEGLRVQLGNDAITYINVGHAMEDVSARQNHTIFARRGCGKTLLLHDSAKALPSDVRAIYLNCEDFKQHTFPNVLIEILSSLFGEIDSHLSGWFGRKVKTKEIVKAIRNRLTQMHRSPRQKIKCDQRRF